MVRQSYVEKCLSRMRGWMALRGLAPNSVSTYPRRLVARRELAPEQVMGTHSRRITGWSR